MSTSEVKEPQDQRLSTAQKMLEDAPAIDFRGKSYVMVKDRLNIFRHVYGTEWQIRAEPVFHLCEGDMVVVAAAISDPDNRVIATGMAEEDRSSGQINRTSALENCETSAIGRALACFGLGGGEFASADELANAVQQQSTSQDKERTAIQNEPSDVGFMHPPAGTTAPPVAPPPHSAHADPLAGIDIDDI